ncbi:MAG: response regulator transcription factor [Acidobacteriota bacterium]
MRAKILVVDDEETLVKLITHNLNREGYETINAFDGDEAWDKIMKESPDLVILDLMIPGRDGMELCRQLRSDKNYTPVIMLTAKDDEVDKILGLEIGADDYMTKPFSVRELLARVKAILRRQKPKEEARVEIISAGDIVLKPEKYEVYVKEQRIDLTLKEFELLELLIRNKGRALKRDYLLDTLWGHGSDANTRVLDVHISKLRDKLRSDNGFEYITTIRGIGYKFEER